MEISAAGQTFVYFFGDIKRGVLLGGVFLKNMTSIFIINQLI